MGEIARGVALLNRRNIGFAFFLAWNYIALYGCGMAIGSFVPYNLEYIWLVAAASTAIVAAASLRRAARRGMPDERRMGRVAAGCAIAGNLALWLSYAFKQFFWVLFPVAGLAYGVTIAFFTVLWGARLTACNEARIEFDVVACLVAAFALYTATLPVKLWGTVDLAVACALPCLSAWLAERRRDDDPDDAWAKARTEQGVYSPFGRRRVAVRLAGVPLPAGGGRAGGDGGGPRAGACLPAAPADSPSLTKALLMMGALWFLVAFFRVVDAPVGAYDRYSRYLIAFSLGFLVTLVLFMVLIRAMRYVDMSMGFRWLLPFAAFNVLVLYAGGGSFGSQVAAYAVIHAGMFGMQMSTWIALAKYLRRNAASPVLAFAGYALAEGVGIFLGCGAGLHAVNLLDRQGLLTAVLAVMCLVVLVVMMTGFSPDWYFARPRRYAKPARTANMGYARGCVGGAGLAREQAAAGGTPAATPTAASIATPTAPTAPAATLLATPAATPTAADQNAAYEEMMRARAERLRRTYRLTERETEVCALLLCGRSRPFIRDELGISLNTVHAHARSILAKCGARSQRDLIDLQVE